MLGMYVAIGATILGAIILIALSSVIAKAVFFVIDYIAERIGK